MRAVWLILLAGCTFTNERQQQQLRSLLPPPDLVDPAAAADPPFIAPADLALFAEKIRQDKQKNLKPDTKVFNILAVSGGGNYGAYCAGVLKGWSCKGDRPTFDVATGISTGAIVAVLAFLGPEYDDEMQRFYTTLNNDAIFKLERPVSAALFGTSVADNAPLAAQINGFMTEDVFQKIAAAHKSGRRLYVGTTNLESKRLVTWDMGAIASRDDAFSRTLFKKILLASAAIPGFFPPVKIDIAAEGRHYQETHVDGGASSAIIVRSPPENEAAPGQVSLAGSNLYILIAGKLYADQDAVRPKTYVIAANSITSILYAITRAQCNEAFSATTLLGMNYYLTAIPEDAQVPLQSTDFDPVEMSKMFDLGCRRMTEGKAWRRDPPMVDEAAVFRKRTNVFLERGKPVQSTESGQPPIPGTTSPTPPTAK